MPQAIPFIGVMFTGTGLFAAGGAISVGLGGGLLGGAIAGALGGALVGAAIGGLTSLVTGGDIGKGLLFGAIGGAVTGGISGFMNAGSFAAMGQNAASFGGDLATNTLSKSGLVWDSVSGEVVGNVAKEGVKKVAVDASGSILGKIGEEGMGALIEGGIGLVGSTLAGKGAEEKWQKEMEVQIAEAEKNRQHEMEKLKMSLSAKGGAGGGGAGDTRDWAAELAENRRQFDAELAQRKGEFAATMGIRKEELYAPMEYQKERVRNAGSALASVGVQRGAYKEGDTIKSQIQAANQYPDAVIEVKPEEATA